MKEALPKRSGASGAALPGRIALGAEGSAECMVLLVWVTHEWLWAVAHPEG